MLNSYLFSKIINIIHMIFILFVIISPFLNNECILSVHFMLIILLWAHWLTNTDHCSLTLAEKALRGIDDEQSYLAKIISPIYKVNKNVNVLLTYGITGILFLITTSKLRNHNFIHLREAFKMMFSFFIKNEK